MSALTIPPPGPALKVTQRRVLRSELTKFRSLRSTAYTLLTAVVLMVGLGARVLGGDRQPVQMCGRAAAIDAVTPA